MGVDNFQHSLSICFSIGFAGHRAVSNETEVTALLDTAFADLSTAFAVFPQLILLHNEERLGAAYGGLVKARLLTGVAPGADRLALSCWQAAELGKVHALVPFCDPATGDPLTDRPDRAGAEDHVPNLSIFSHWTGFDSVALDLEGDQGHAEVGRWIVRHSDVLLAVWNGEPGRGPGGTADTVHRALERGLPVIWIRPGEETVRLIEPHRFRRGVTASEAIFEAEKTAQPLTVELLTSALAANLIPPGAPPGPNGKLDPEVVARRDYAEVDPLKPRGFLSGRMDSILDATVWRSFAVFKRTVGDLGRWAPPADLVKAFPGDWVDQPAFTLIQQAFDQADRRANRLSDIHRSQQLLLVLAAVLAVLVGAMPILLRESQLEGRLHQISVAGEFLLGAFAFVVTLLARRAHRHRRWSDARRLAERLRAARATWLLGIDIADAHVSPPQTWTEWRARAVLRAAGPPTGWLDREQFQQRTAWAASELIDGQIGYHAKEHHAAEHIENAIKRAEEGAFIVLMASLGGYLLATWVLPRFGVALPDWVGAAITVIGAVSPAIGAAGLALEATNGFNELALRSHRLRLEFEKLKAELGAGGQNSFNHKQDVLRTAAQLLVEDADSWRDRAVRRRLVRGG